MAGKSEWRSAVGWLVAFLTTNLLGCIAIAFGKPLEIGMMLIIYPLQAWLAAQAFLGAAWLVFGHGVLWQRVAAVAGFTAVTAAMIAAFDNGAGVRSLIVYAPLSAFVVGLLVGGLLRLAGIELRQTTDVTTVSPAIAVADLVRWLAIVGGSIYLNEFFNQLSHLHGQNGFQSPALITGGLVVGFGIYLGATALRRQRGRLSFAVELFVMAPLICFALDRRLGILSLLPAWFAIAGPISQALRHNVRYVATFGRAAAANEGIGKLQPARHA